MANFSRLRRAFCMSLVSLFVAVSGCRTTSPGPAGDSSIKSIWIPQGGLIVKKGFLIYASQSGEAVCYASVSGGQGQILAQSETNSFKSILTQLYQQQTRDPSASTQVENFYQSYIRGSAQYDATRFTDYSAQILTNLSYQAAYQGQSPSNTNACATVGGGGGGTSGQNPSHLFVLLSYGRSVTPGRTHTFGFFAKMDPNVKDKIIEHVPFSWLPVVTSPADDINGTPRKDSEGNFQIADVMSALTRPRLGWNFSISKTFKFRKDVLGSNDVTGNGAFVVTASQYEQAKRFYDQMNQNTRMAAQGRIPSAYGYFYQAANDTLFSCPNGKAPSNINCFQTIMAAFGTCETSGPLSGVGVTEFLRGKLQGRRLIGDAYYRDQREIANLLNQVEKLEGGGKFDRVSNY